MCPSVNAFVFVAALRRGVARFLRVRPLLARAQAERILPAEESLRARRRGPHPPRQARIPLGTGGGMGH